MNAPIDTPLSLYIHIPWCVRKCPYCDFNSHAQRDELPEQAYTAALLEDLEQELKDAGGRPIESIFIGGGTPSLFSSETLSAILDGVRQRADLVDMAEITMEANPGTFEQQRFAGFREAGVNRLSIGVQSFSTEQLIALGRIHNGEEAYSAISAARAIGFDNINLDLMHGLPGQNVELALHDLNTAISLEPDHLSWYQLTIEPNTEFNARPPTLPVDEILWDIQEQGMARLSEAGYQQYEVSAYAKPGRQARHNLNYWQFGDYIGIGAGAHGKLSSQEDGIITRRWKQKQPKAYMTAEGRFGGEQHLTADELPFEFMLNALRLTDGFSLELFTQRTGLKLSSVQPQLDEAIAKDLLEQQGPLIRPTTHGRLFLNNLIELFL